MDNIITNVRIKNIHKLHLLNGGGLFLSNILNKGYIVINIKDYNNVSTEVL